MPTPQNKQDVRRLLGMVNYLQKFSPNLSDATSDLRNLLQEDVLFHWDPHDQGERVKQLLTTAPLLKFFNPKEEVELQCDASEGDLGHACSKRGSPSPMLPDPLPQQNNITHR